MSRFVEGYVGRRGRGKSYTLVCRVLKIHHRYRVVASNMYIDVPNLLLVDGPADLMPGGPLDDVLAVHCMEGYFRAFMGRRRSKRRYRARPWKVLVILDEAQNWFPSRNSAKLPASVIWLWSQTRKLEWDVLWSSQQAERVDKVVRDNTDWIHVSQPWFSFLTLTGRPLFFTSRAWEPERLKARKKKESAAPTIRFFRWTVARAFDTKNTIALSSHIAEIQDHYTNPKVTGR